MYFLVIIGGLIFSSHANVTAVMELTNYYGTSREFNALVKTEQLIDICLIDLLTVLVTTF